MTRNSTGAICKKGRSLKCIVLPFSEAGARSIKLRHFSPLKEKDYFRRQKVFGFALPPLSPGVPAIAPTWDSMAPPHVLSHRADVYWASFLDKLSSQGRSHLQSRVWKSPSRFWFLCLLLGENNLIAGKEPHNAQLTNTGLSFTSMDEEDSTDSANDRYLLCKNNQFYTAYVKLSIKKKTKKQQTINSKFWVPVIVFLATTAAKQPESHILTQG